MVEVIVDFDRFENVLSCCGSHLPWFNLGSKGGVLFPLDAQFVIWDALFDILIWIKWGFIVISSHLFANKFFLFFLVDFGFSLVKFKFNNGRRWLVLDKLGVSLEDIWHFLVEMLDKPVVTAKRVIFDFHFFISKYSWDRTTLVSDAWGRVKYIFLHQNSWCDKVHFLRNVCWHIILVKKHISQGLLVL